MYFKRCIAALCLSSLLSTSFSGVSNREATDKGAENKERSELYNYFWHKSDNLPPVNTLTQSKFYQIVNLNSLYSTAYNDFCFNNDLCFSGLTNIDAVYFDRLGNGAGFGSFIGVAVRPLFGPKSVEYFGNLNNADIFIDGRVNDWTLLHFDVAYVNGSLKTRYYNHNNADWGDVYRNAAAIKANEAVVIFSNPEKLPFFIKFGKQYLNFGDYKPFPITESLTQLITQIRTGAIIGGVVLPNGFYASANWSMANQSIDLINNFGLFGGTGSKNKNWGGQVGINNVFFGVKVNANASYIADIRDADYLSGGAQTLNYDFKDVAFGTFVFANQAFVMARTPGVALHADLEKGPFGVMAEYTRALKRLNPAALNSQIYAWLIGGNVKYRILDFLNQFDVSYQRADNSNVFNTILLNPAFPIPPNPFGIPVPFTVGNVLPKSRIQLTYSVYALPNVIVSLQWLRDKDSPIAYGGTNLKSEKGAIRVSAQI
jgi:hypothetical protein